MSTTKERIELLVAKTVFSLNLPLPLLETVARTYVVIKKVLNMNKQKEQLYEDEYGIINLTGKKTNPEIFSSKLDKLSSKLKRQLRRKEKKKEKQQSKEWRLFKDDDGYITTSTGNLATSLDNPNNKEYFEYDGATYTRNITTGEVEYYYDYKYMHRITDNLASGAIGCKVDEGWVIVPVYDLDDHEHDVEKVKAKIELVSNLVNAGFKVCVCCLAGINRSNTIVIGTLMNLDSSGIKVKHLWDKYLRQVKSKVPYAFPFPTIRGSCKIAVSELKYGKRLQPVQSITHYFYLREFVPLRRPYKQLQKVKVFYPLMIRQESVTA